MFNYDMLEKIGIVRVDTFRRLGWLCADDSSRILVILRKVFILYLDLLPLVDFLLLCSRGQCANIKVE